MAVVVITGSTRGIGREIAKSMLQQSAECRVVVNGSIKGIILRNRALSK